MKDGWKGADFLPSPPPRHLSCSMTPTPLVALFA